MPPSNRKPRATIRVGQVFRDGDKRLLEPRYFVVARLEPNDRDRARMLRCDRHGFVLANCGIGQGETRISLVRLAKGDWVYQGKAAEGSLGALRVMGLSPDTILFHGDVEPTPEVAQ